MARMDTTGYLIVVVIMCKILMVTVMRIGWTGRWPKNNGIVMMMIVMTTTTTSTTRQRSSGGDDCVPVVMRTGKNKRHEG